MSNTGAGIVISVCLVLGTIYSFKWYFVVFIILAICSWSIHVYANLQKRILELDIRKLELEITQLENKLKR